MNLKDALFFIEGDKKTVSINVMVLSGADISTGKKKDGTEWRKRNYTIQDSTATATITTWGANIDRLAAGKQYNLDGIQRSIYQDKTQLTFTDWSKANEIKQGNLDSAQEQPKQSEDEFYKKKQEELKAQQVQKENTTQNIDPSIAELVKHKTELLYAISQNVIKTLRQFEENPNPAQVGQFVNLIWQEMKEAKA